jgi:hypothetical protein
LSGSRPCPYCLPSGAGDAWSASDTKAQCPGAEYFSATRQRAERSPRARWDRSAAQAVVLRSVARRRQSEAQQASRLVRVLTPNPGRAWRFHGEPAEISGRRLAESWDRRRDGGQLSTQANPVAQATAYWICLVPRRRRLTGRVGPKLFECQPNFVGIVKTTVSATNAGRCA